MSVQVDFQDIKRRCRPSLGLVMVFSMGVNVLALTVSIYMLQVMDRVIMSRSLETLFFLTLLALAALVTFGILDWSRNRVMNRLAQWLEDRLSGPLARLRLYNSLHLPGVGQDPVQDLRHVSATMVSPAFLALFDSPWAPLYLGLIFLLHPALGWLALAGMIILVIIAAVGDYLTRNRHKDIQQAVSQSSGLLGLYGSNADSLGAMGMTDRLLNRWQGRHGAATAAAQRTADSSAAITALTKTARLMLQIGILGLGAYLAVLDELTPGAMIAASIILSRALAPVEQSVGSWRNLSNAWHSANRLYTLLKTAPLDAQTLPVEPENGTVAVSNLYYRAHNTPDPILTGLTWSIAQGTHLAILGRSGSGKSTLARLLVGTLKSLNGSIEIAGLDPLTAHPEAFGQNIGYLAQRFTLMDGTVAENIARFTDAHLDEVIEAAKAAHCHEMIVRLPYGYDTEVTAGNVTGEITPGQAQRIGLARALFGGPKVLVLDEPDTNLDQEGQFALLRTLQAIRSLKKTVILVTHRPELIRGSDHVLMLDQGKQSFFGSTQDFFAQLQADQSKKPGRPSGADKPTAERSGPYNVTINGVTQNDPFR